MNNPSQAPDEAGVVERRAAWIKLLRRHHRKTSERLGLKHDAVKALADLLEALSPPPVVEEAGLRKALEACMGVIEDERAVAVSSFMTRSGPSKRDVSPEGEVVIARFDAALNLAKQALATPASSPPLIREENQ